MDDDKSVAIHSFVKWLSRFMHILETTPPKLYQINDSAGFARRVYSDGELFASCFTNKHICGLQYGAGLARVSIVWAVVRCLVCKQCQSCMHEQILTTIRPLKGDYWWQSNNLI